MAIFKVRSPERDAKTDLGRLRRIATAMGDAISFAIAEREALAKRVDEATALGSFAMGTQYDGSDREAEDTKLISGYEKQMKNGYSRLLVLDRQIEDLKMLEKLFETKFGADHRGAGESTDPS